MNKVSRIFTESEFNERVKMYWNLMVKSEFNKECPPIEHDKAKRRTRNLGKAHYNPMKFSFSFRMLDGRFSLENIDDIIKHEIGHILAYIRFNGRQKHNSNFQKIAKEFGFNGSPHSNIKVVEGFKDDSPQRAKYRVYCTNCNKEWFKNRTSKLIENPEKYICPCKAQKTLKIEILY